jgi:PAS domain-containing protein
MERPRQADVSTPRMQLLLLAENRKERRNQKNEDMLRKLSRAVEQSADMVMITNREGVIEYVNPAFELLTGYSPGELMARPRGF